MWRFRRRRRRRTGCAAGCAIIAAILVFLFAGGVAFINRLLQQLNTPTASNQVVNTSGTTIPVSCTPVATYGQPGYMSGFVVDVNSKKPIAGADVAFSVYTETADCGVLAGEWHLTTDVNGYFSTYPSYEIAPVVSGNNIQNNITVSAPNCQPLTLPFDSIRDFSHRDDEGTFIQPTPFLGNTIELPC